MLNTRNIAAPACRRTDHDPRVIDRGGGVPGHETSAQASDPYCRCRPLIRGAPLRSARCQNSGPWSVSGRAISVAATPTVAPRIAETPPAANRVRRLKPSGRSGPALSDSGLSAIPVCYLAQSTDSETRSERQARHPGERSSRPHCGPGTLHPTGGVRRRWRDRQSTCGRDTKSGASRVR